MVAAAKKTTPDGTVPAQVGETIPVPADGTWSAVGTASNPPVDGEPAGEQIVDTGGWFRNTSAGPLTVVPEGAPSAVLEPGGATWLPRDPSHPHLQPCDTPPPKLPDDTETEV